MRILPTASCLLLLAITTAIMPVAAAESLVPLYSYSLYQPYIEDTLVNRYWDFGGDAIVEVNKYVRLAQDMQSRRGWIWTKTPLTASSWEVEFEFKVSGSSDSLYGDGFAFWHTNDSMKQGPVFGSQDKFLGLGVFFDTYVNGRHRGTIQFPLVQAMIGDGETSYDNNNDGVDNQVGSCKADFRKVTHMTRAKVRYLAHTSLEVLLDVKGANAFESCFKVDDVSLPPSGYLGFSSHTGDASDNHDIIRVMTYSILNAVTKPAPDTASQKNKTPSGTAGKAAAASQTTLKPSKGHVPSEGGWSVLSVLFVVALFAVVAFGGYVYFRMKQHPKTYKSF